MVAALREDDLDHAIDLGLLDDIACLQCNADCTQALAQARDARRNALAARERYRDRTLRLARLQRERDAQRKPVTAPTGAPALPAAAAAALERAKARAAQRKD
ncbi:hypothetical protein GN331_13305 [Lysobacter sp. HX-5-24]|uniref:Uncharacterized protein n=1 Tax=Noviluteimonas gilva TaxID=2682097 RepID=A0A7C9HNE9_9GAMM|nr:hypothetical protein [Lysobacter gilvus]